MSPLRLIGDRPLAIEAAQIAENVVAALLDINENQIYQSSRRYLYHAVIGAIAIAHRDQRRARLEDVYTLLRPAKDEFRAMVAEACAAQPDLDQTAEFFASELPDDLRMATSRVAERLDAPRNKISGLTGVPPLRRFFNHPTDIPLREIIHARDILIVDANMAAIGTENSKACMLFILRMLHAQLQRQVRLPERDRPRVPLIVDEAHYVAGGENVVDQIATHRAAGLEPAFGLQYFAQLGSASEHQQKILKGVLNLLQSRFLFRMGDAQDAEQATRIAMAVYSTMIRDDPDSRARLRVTPEQLLNFPNYYCLASWIAHGTRAPAFTGETYPLPDLDEHMGRAPPRPTSRARRPLPRPARLHPRHPPTHHQLAEQRWRAGTQRSRPRLLRASTSTSPTSRRTRPSDWERAGTPGAQRWYIPAGTDPAPFDRWRNPDHPPPAQPHTPTRTNQTPRQPTVTPVDDSVEDTAQPTNEPPGRAPRHQVQVDYEAPPEPPNLADSPVRRIVGRPSSTPPRNEHDAPAPDSLRDLAFLDRINEIGAADHLDGAAKLPRLYDADYAILALLDRVGLAPITMIGRSILPNARPPDRL